MVNEELANQKPENQSERRMETQQDVQVIQQELKVKKEKIIEEAPKLSFEVKNAPFYLNILFDQNGNPKGDFVVTERCMKKVCAALKHPHQKARTGEIYWGNLDKYFIKTTPTFLTEEELIELQKHHKLTKKINNIDIELVPPMSQRDNYPILPLSDTILYSDRVQRYRENIKVPRRKVQEINNILSDLEILKSRLPMGVHEVIIDQEEEPEKPQTRSHK